MALDDQLASLLAQNADLFAAYENLSNGQVMMLAGSATDPASYDANGGKNGPLGYYPLININGQTVYAPCLDRLKTIALEAAAAIAPTHSDENGAVGGERSIPAPAAVPANSPYWVRVAYNGAPQKPGIDFTTDGSATIHLNFTLSAGDTWFVEQIQRNV